MEEELNTAISKLKTNTSPGPDGFTSEWYKTFRSELIPTLLQMLNVALRDGKILVLWREATISVIPRKEKTD